MGTTSSRHRGAGPTLARLIAIRVLERVDRVRAFADLSLHSALAQSDLSGLDRALATDIVYGALRWRGRIDFMLGHVLDRKLEALSAYRSQARPSPHIRCEESVTALACLDFPLEPVPAEWATRFTLGWFPLDRSGFRGVRHVAPPVGPVRPVGRRGQTNGVSTTRTGSARPRTHTSSAVPGSARRGGT